jgi:hypothetical protein
MSKIKEIRKNLDRGFYTSAKAQATPRSSYGYLTDLCLTEGFGPSEDQISRRADKFLGRVGYKGEALNFVPEGIRDMVEQHVLDTWGLEQALGDAGIRVKGYASDKLEKFFATGTSTILFPAYIESQIITGVMMASLLSSLVATETNINSHTYQSLVMTDTEATRSLSQMQEGAKFATTKISTSERAIYLQKFGRMLEWTYEANRLCKIDLIGKMLQRMGMQIGLDETDWAVETLIAGDGNTGSPVTPILAEVSGTLDYDELVRLFLAFKDGYTMNTAVINDTWMRKILNLSEFKDPMAGFTFQRNGVMPGPMGATWHVWRSTGSTSFADDRILAIDSRFALEKVTEQGVTMETDKIIDGQWNRTTISCWTGFSKMDYDAVQLLDITHGG